MAGITGVKGLSVFIRAMKAKKGQYAKKMERGLLRAGLFLQAKAQADTPVDTAALKNSARTTKEGKGFETVVSVSFLQPYGIFVEEREDLHHEVGKAHFLRDAVIDNWEEIREIVKDELQ